MLMGSYRAKNITLNLSKMILLFKKTDVKQPTRKYFDGYSNFPPSHWCDFLPF